MAVVQSALSPESLRETREALGWSQKALAEHLGVAGNTLARWERGELDYNRVLVGLALERLCSLKAQKLVS